MKCIRSIVLLLVLLVALTTTPAVSAGKTKYDSAKKPTGWKANGRRGLQNYSEKKKLGEKANDKPVSDEKTTDPVSFEETKDNSAVESTGVEASEKAVKKTKEPSEKKSTKEPFEKKSTKEPSAKKSTKEPSEKKSTKAPSEKKSTKEPSAKKSKEESSAKKSTKEPSAKTSKKESSAKTSTKEPSAKKSKKESSSKTSTKEPSAKKSKKETSVPTPAPSSTDLTFLKEVDGNKDEVENNDRDLFSLIDEEVDTGVCKCVFCEEDEACGGLWFGEEKNGDANRFTKMQIVVSHCINDLDWLAPFIEDIKGTVNITVISKCDSPVDGVPENTKIIRLPNVGRCDHSYAYWLAYLNPYGDEEDVAVVFLKDDISYANLHQVGFWRPLRELLEISSVRGFACAIETTKFGINEDMVSLSIYHKWDHLATFSLATYARTKAGYLDATKDTFKSNFTNLGDWADQTSGDALNSYTIVPVCYGGAFATTASNIKKRDNSVWENIERTLSRGDNIEEGHFAERAWASLLSNPLSIDESRALIKYADYIYDSCGESICGALVHMPTLFESMLIDATSLETIRKITKEKVDLNSTVGKKPKLYLHIGPPKHDTTSLQCALARMQTELNIDNYHYIGINNKNCTGKDWAGELPQFDTDQSIDLVVECFNKGDACDTSRWQAFVDLLSQYGARNSSVIYSFESFGTIDFVVEANKKRFLSLTEDWDVEIIVAYRHYHDWVPSLYLEMYKFLVLMYGKGELWPEEGGFDMPSFPDSFDDRFEKPLSDTMEFLYSTNSLTVYRTFLQMFDSVSVIDIHESRSSEKWICSLPGADDACAKVSLMNVTVENEDNEYAELVMFDLIVLAARKKGLVDPYLARDFVRDEAQIFAKTFDADYILPLKCLSTHQEQELYKLSAKLADVMPVNASVDSTFGAAISKNKFCGVDEAKVLADQNWLDFFLALWTEEKEE